VSPLSILLLAVALAADAFSVAVVSGLVCRGARATFRLAFHFALFQAFMPVLGGLSGSLLHESVAAYDHWIASGLLAFIGLRMVVASFRKDGEETPRRDPSKGLAMVGLSVATSIDAFGAGVGLAMTDTNLLWACLTIGVVTAVLTMIGMRIGRVAGPRFGPWSERFGGLVLVGLAVRLLWTM
jgi:manganese efflux pump family protein